MHYKDGTPAKLGDIVQHDNGSVGIVIGGQIGGDACSTQTVFFRPAVLKYSDTYLAPSIGSAFVGGLRGADQAIVARSAVVVDFEQNSQTREMLKIGHVDLGHG